MRTINLNIYTVTIRGKYSAPNVFTVPARSCISMIVDMYVIIATSIHLSFAFVPARTNKDSMGEKETSSYNPRSGISLFRSFLPSFFLSFARSPACRTQRLFCVGIRDKRKFNERREMPEDEKQPYISCAMLQWLSSQVPREIQRRYIILRNNAILRTLSTHCST